MLVVVLAAGFLGFLYYRDKIFSKQILKLEILGSETAAMGDQIQYTVKYKNNGNFVLEQPKLIFQLPDNSLTEDGKLRFSKDLKDIYPGQEDVIQFDARLLGKEGDLKLAHAWLSYIPKNLSARYESDTTFTTKIDTVPVTLSYDLPSKVEKGKEITYAINYFSNIDYPLENLSVKVDAVSGFAFESADPKSLDNNEWKLAGLTKAQGGRISMKGLVNGDTGSHITFSAKLGMWQDGSFIVVKEASQDVEVISPLLFISEQVNNATNYIASPGEKLHYQIFFRNISSTPFDNLFIMVHLNGSAFDLSALTSDNGQVRASDNLIVWDAKQIAELQHLPPNQETSVDFTVAVKNNWTPADAEKNNIALKNEVNVSGISQAFVTKVNSNLTLSQKAYYSKQSDIENSGPVPPETGKTTTYTIVWQIGNSFNDVNKVKVRALLPHAVALTSKLSPDSQMADFSFDSTSREMGWSAGNLLAGATGALPSLSFQVALTPTIAQQGNAVSLIGPATISGEDQATGNIISSTASAIDTSLPDDKSNSSGGVVR